MLSSTQEEVVEGHDRWVAPEVTGQSEAPHRLPPLERTLVPPFPQLEPSSGNRLERARLCGDRLHDRGLRPGEAPRQRVRSWWSGVEASSRGHPTQASEVSAWLVKPSANQAGTGCFSLSPPSGYSGRHASQPSAYCFKC